MQKVAPSMPASTRSEASVADVQPLTAGQIQAMVDVIIEVLGEPRTHAQRRALEEFGSGDNLRAKRVATFALGSRFETALSYLSSALKNASNPVVAETAIQEAARAAADSVRERVLLEASDRFREIAGSL